MTLKLRTLDFSTFTLGNQESKVNFCKDLYESCATFGFVKLVNFGISDAEIQNLFNWCDKFFALPEEVKQKTARRPHVGPNRGWSPYGSEKLSGITRGPGAQKVFQDAKESFDQGPADDTVFPNTWPPESDLPGFRLFMDEMYSTCHSVHLQILSALELGLSLSQGRLVSLCSAGNAELRLTHYPAIDVRDLTSGKVNRISEHADLGTVTMLFQDSVGGLEVEDQTHPGTFFPVHSTGKTEMILNVGDTLQRWTGDKLKSAVHKVTVPVGIEEGIVPKRLSVGFFGKADPTITLGPLKEFAQNEQAQKYEDIPAVMYYRQMQEKTYPQGVKAVGA